MRGKEMERPKGTGVGGWKGRGGSLAVLHGAVFLFGLAGLFGKWVQAPALMIVFARVFFAALVLAPVVSKQGGLRLPAGADGRLVLACGGLLAFHWGAFFQAIQVSTVSIGLLGYATTPVFAALLEPWFFRERFSRPGFFAALLTVGGMAAVVPRWSVEETALWGLGWGMAAGGSFALLSLANRRLRVGLGSVRLAFFQDGIAFLMLAPLAPWFWKTPSAWELGLLGLLGVFCTAGAHGMFIHSLKKMTAREATLVGNLEPVYGIGLAWLLLGEPITPRTLAGGALILGAALWVTWASTREAGRESPA